MLNLRKNDYQVATGHLIIRKEGNKNENQSKGGFTYEKQQEKVPRTKRNQGIDR